MKMECGRRAKLLLCRFSHRNLQAIKKDKDPNINMQMEIPLSRSISNANNDWLTKKIMMEEVPEHSNKLTP